MADVKQTIKIEQIADVRDVLKGIDQIQNALKKLEVGPETQASFNKLFNNIERQAEKANSAIASGFKNKSDVKNYTTAMDQIVSSYDKIITKIKVLQTSGKVTLKVDTTEFETLNKEISALQTKLKTFNSDMLKATNTLNGVEKRRGTGTNNVASWQKAIDAYRNGEIQKTTQALNTLKGMMTKASNSGIDLTKDKDWKQFKADYDNLTQAIKDYDAANKASVQTQNEINSKQSRTKEILETTSRELDKIETSAEKGAQGLRAFNEESRGTVTSTQQLNSELEHFKNKAAYFFGIANGINLFKRALRSAYATVKDLDKVMTETAVVTNFDVGDMWSQLPEYTQRANELGVSIHSAYEAATIFYQQGLKTNEVMAVSNETLKMARIAGLDAATASDRMTNALRGFNMEMDKMSAQRVNDVYSKLAAITASNTDEISTAMTKVASLAHNANMEFETTSAFLAQMIETTRESAETAGTALKTVVARFSEVKKLYSKGELMGQDEEGGEIDVNKVSTALRSAGINLNEYLTGAKGLDDIFIELASKWDSLDKVQQRYIATMAAGSRQQSRFIAMMSDYKRTTELVAAANNANGASQEQYAKTLDSLETKLSRLQNAWNEFVLGLANSDAIKGAVDLLTNLLTAINKIIGTLSGKNAGRKMIISFFTAFSAFKMGSKLVGKNNTITKIFTTLTEASEKRVAQSANALANVYTNGLSQSLEKGLNKKINNSAFLNYFAPEAVYDKKNMRSVVYKSGAMDKANINQKIAMNTAIKSGDTNEVNKLLKEQGSQIQLNEKEMNKFGVTTEGVTKRATDGWKVAGAAAVAFGGILVSMGDWVKNLGKEWEGFGIILKSLGVGLIAFGTILSVTLPIQAALGAKAISASIMGIPIVGWIAAIISAIIALGAAIYSFTKNNSYDTKMKKAADASKSAADAADEATKAYEKLGQAWNSLQDKYDAIDKATIGTQKWKDAIKEANNEALQLVATYSKLKVKIGKDGRLEISAESKDELEDVLRQRKDMANAELLGAQLSANYVKIEGIEDKLKNSNVTGMRGEQLTEWQSAYNGQTYTRETALENIVKTARGGQINSLEQLKEEAKKYLPGPGLAESIREEDFRILKNYIEAPGLADASKTQYNALLSNALTNVKDQKSINYAKNFIGTEDIGKIYEKELEKAKQKPTKFAQEDYATNLKYDDYAAWKRANDGKDVEGVEGKLAGQETQKKIDALIQLIGSKMGGLTELQRKFFEEEGGGALTQDEIDQLRGQWASILNTIGEEELKDIGYDEEGIANLEKRFTDTLNNAYTNATTKIEGLNGDLIDSLTAGARKSLQENLESVEIASGKEGRKEITDIINKITEGKNKQQRDAFINSLTQIDWASANSIRTLSDLVKEYGYSEDAIKGFENKIVKLNNAATKTDLTKVTDQLKSLMGLSKKISIGSQGRSFSKEDYENLITKGGMDPSKFEYNIETGNYDYIGDKIDDVIKAIYDQTNKLIDTEQLEKDVKSSEAAEKVQKEGEPKTDADKIDYIKKYIKGAGDNSKISDDWLKYATDEAKKGNYDIANKLISIIDNEAKALPERKDELENYGKEKEAMQRQLNSGVINAEDATHGSKPALDTLKGQIASLNIPKELQDELIAGMNPDSGKFLESTKKAGSIIDTFKEAGANGISAEDLNAYADALQRVNGLEKISIEQRYQMALGEAKYQEGMKSLISTYGDWSKLIDKKNGGFKIPQPNTASFKVYEKMKQDVAKMLNSSEKIPDEFFKSKKNAELLQKAVKGSKKAAAALAAELAKVNMGNLGFKDGKDLTQQGKNLIDQIQKELPDLKIGTTFDEGSIEMQLAKLLSESGKTVDEVNKIMGNLGIGMEWKTEEVDIGTIQKTNTTGYQEIVHKDGTKEKVPVKSLSEYAENGKVRVLVPKRGTFNKPPKLSPPKTTAKNKGGGGGKKKAKAKKERWENPYDELYNLQEKINESLRKREALERRYQKLLKQEQSSLSDIRKSYYDQIKQIRTEANLQKELEAGRLRQIDNIGKQTYVDSKGNVKTFDQMGVTKYAKYNKETGAIEIKWEEIQALEGTKHVEIGKAVEAYISKLEELVSSYEEVRDKLWELEDKIEEFREAAIDAYLSFEDRVMDALVDHYQKEIDSYQAMSDAIDKVNNEVISSLREQIDLSRQIRDNTEKEEDISKKENRLAYLQRDTSGANDLEILSLQKELKDAREGYSDTLVDQAIDKMQKDADTASEQRQRQIETMQAQLNIAKETGALWKQVYTLMSDAAKSEIFSEDSELAKLLKDGEAFKALSNIGQKNWWAEVGKAFRESIIGRDEAEDKFKTDANNDGTIANTGTSDYLKEIGEMNTQANVTADTYERTDEQNYGAAAAIVMGEKNHGGWGATNENWKNNLKEKGFDPGAVLDIVEVFNAQKKAWDAAEAATQKKKGKYKKGKKKGKWKYTVNPWTGWKVNGVTDWKKYQMSQFKTGGLADKTGPAWLDGTRSHPELVLNSQDTRNFIALKDILASLMNPQNKTNTAAAGNVYLDIDINADIGSDYDVDRLASRIKKQIFDEGQYRNINTISFLR